MNTRTLPGPLSHSLLWGNWGTSTLFLETLLVLLAQKCWWENKEILVLEGHSYSRVGAWHSQACADSRGKRLGPVPHGRRNLLSQFLISGLRVFPALESLPDPQRPQSRPGMALFCPLAYIPCPGQSPLTAQDRARQTYQTLQGLLSPLVDHLQVWGTAPEPGWRQQGQRREAYRAFGPH